MIHESEKASHDRTLSILQFCLCKTVCVYSSTKRSLKRCSPKYQYGLSLDDIRWLLFHILLHTFLDCLSMFLQWERFVFIGAMLIKKNLLVTFESGVLIYWIPCRLFFFLDRKPKYSSEMHCLLEQLHHSSFCLLLRGYLVTSYSQPSYVNCNFPIRKSYLSLTLLWQTLQRVWRHWLFLYPRNWISREKVIHENC